MQNHIPLLGLYTYWQQKSISSLDKIENWMSEGHFDPSVPWSVSVQNFTIKKKKIKATGPRKSSWPPVSSG